MVLRQFVKRYGWGSSLGDRHEGHIGASILANAGLTDFIAQDIDGYKQLAVEMAANTNYLKEIKEGFKIANANDFFM
jgi:predicted O-linked N-acetylglucosamine transferase (SPINDLY family)